MYRFRQIDDYHFSPSSKLMLPHTVLAQQFVRSGHYGEYLARVRGALLALFGDPLDDGSDAVYRYRLEATDEIGKSWTVTAYEGASGASIAGNPHDQSVYPVAQALQQLIDTTPPRDFEVTRYDDEYDATITYGCKDSIPYYYETRGSVPRASGRLG
jgi:hypothetical protein